MNKLILIFIITASVVFAFEKKNPRLEDFQLKDFESTNFKNLLLNPSSPIDNFYVITDSGEIYEVKDMGLNPKVTKVFEIDGFITEAITYDSSHYLSLNSNSNCYLIKTNNFVEIDTLYFDTEKSIADFNIYQNTINLMVLDKNTTTIFSKKVDESNWNELNVEFDGYNRIASLYDNLYLFKFLGEDTNILIYNGETKTWDEREYYNEDISSIAEIKPRDSLLFICGKYGQNVGSYFYAISKDLEYRRFFSSARGKTIVLDIEFDFDFNWRKNPSDTYQIGTSEIAEEGAFFNKFIYEGSGEGNKILYPYSTSLNKIKSNEETGNKEFVAVGNNGIVLIINRGETPVKNESKIIAPNGFISYPNPVQALLVIESEKPINHIEISDITGRTLITQSNINNYKRELDLSNFSTGIYFLKVNDQVQKIIVE